MDPAMSRAFDSILRRKGEDAVLRGEHVTPKRRVHIAHDVELTGGYGEVASRVTAARMWCSYKPLPGDTLAVCSGSYVIDSPPMLDNGVSCLVILRKVD